MDTQKVAKFFDSIKDNEIQSYNDYWAELKPQTESAIFKRYLFAFMSVHTTWESNCKGYNAIKEFRKWTLEQSEQLELWNYNHSELFKKLFNSRVGLHNNRTKSIGKFADEFWINPAKYASKLDSESWVEWRDRLCKGILGLGKAKTSFAIEMLFPVEAQVVAWILICFKYMG